MALDDYTEYTQAVIRAAYKDATRARLKAGLDRQTATAEAFLATARLMQSIDRSEQLRAEKMGKYHG